MLAIEDKRKQAEAICVIDENDDHVVRVLTKLGYNLLDMLRQPENLAFVRIVIGASAQFPEIGRAFYEAGPAVGIARLANYLRRMTSKGVLDVEEPERAARHYMDLCKSGIHSRTPFGYASELPSREAMTRSVEPPCSSRPTARLDLTVLGPQSLAAREKRRGAWRPVLENGGVAANFSCGGTSYLRLDALDQRAMFR